MYQESGPLHPAAVDHVPGERGAPARHVQLLLQLPHLLLSLQPVQGGAEQGLPPAVPPAGGRGAARPLRLLLGRHQHRRGCYPSP